MATMPQPAGSCKAQWEAVLETTMRVAVRAAIERVVEEELTAALGPRYGRRAPAPGIATA